MRCLSRDSFMHILPYADNAQGNLPQTCYPADHPGVSALASRLLLELLGPFKNEFGFRCQSTTRNQLCSLFRLSYATSMKSPTRTTRSAHCASHVGPAIPADAITCAAPHHCAIENPGCYNRMHSSSIPACLIFRVCTTSLCRVPGASMMSPATGTSPTLITKVLSTQQAVPDNIQKPKSSRDPKPCHGYGPFSPGHSLTGTG